MKKAVLAVSFGTTHEDTREKTIDKVEELLAQEFSDYQLQSAYTSGMICRAMEKRGIQIFSPKQALEQLLSEGVEEVIIQPTHLICGEEFDRLKETVLAYKGRFSGLKLGMPLMASSQDITEAAHFLSEQFPKEKGTALVLMGHGSSHPADSVYDELQEIFVNSGREDIFVGTVEGKLGVPVLSKECFQKVVLTPLMLVAGDHAKNDMAGDESDSWKNIYQEQGYEVEVVLKGLGEYQTVREMYLHHAKQAEEI